MCVFFSFFLQTLTFILLMVHPWLQTSLISVMPCYFAAVSFPSEWECFFVLFFFYLGRKQKEEMERKEKGNNRQTNGKKSPDLQKQPNRVKRSLKLSGLIFCISNGKASVSRHPDGSLLSQVINHWLRHRNPMGSILYTPLIKEAPLR